MLPISWYLLKVLIVSSILSGYYFLVLKDKAFHHWNRFYLLGSVVLSLMLPLLKINVFDAASGSGPVMNTLQTFTMQDEIVIEMGKNPAWNTNMLVISGYLLVSLALIFTLLFTLLRIARIKSRNPGKIIHGVYFINTDETGTPFSFFNSLFWNRSIDLNSTAGQQILDHELAHIREKHSHDKMFMNIVLLFFWINPFFWLIRKELYMIHEFIADRKAIEDNDVQAFAAMILSSVYPGRQFSITNNFFHSPIKRRLFMLSKNNKSKVGYAGRLFVLPLAALVFIAFSCKVKTAENEKTNDNVTASQAIAAENDTSSTSLTAAINHSGRYYNGKEVTSAEGTSSGEKVILHYTDGTQETISAKDAVKAGFTMFTPPGVVKDKYGNELPPPQVKVQFTPPKSIKDKDGRTPKPVVPFAPPKSVRGVKIAPPKSVKRVKIEKDQSDKVYKKVEKEAIFPGGARAWTKYIVRAITAHIDEIKDENDYGTCIVKFIVNKDGTVSDVTAATMQGTAFAKIAVDAVRKGPKWVPTQQDGRYVSAYRMQPVTLQNPN